MHRFDFPTGSEIALHDQDFQLSFDALHRLRSVLQDEFLKHLPDTADRVLGCLRDDVSSLIALINVTELVEYMPINPDLADAEMRRLIASSGATVGILSKEALAARGDMFERELGQILDWDDILASSLRRLEGEEGIVTDPSANPHRRKSGLILHTSGSTGTPKRVPISLQSMNASAKNIAESLQLADTDLALNILPTFHIGALVDVLMAPFQAKGAVAISSDREPAKLAQRVIELRPTWIQLVPTILRRMVEDLDAATLRDVGRSLSFIRSISAPVSAELKAKAEGLLGCPIVEMYGMTETAGQITSNPRDQNGEKIGSVGRATNVDVILLDETGNPVPVGKTGEVCVSGPTVFEGYEGVGKDEVFFDDWFRTGDLGEFDAEGYLYLRGRLKEMINVGGEKVSPAEIERVVAERADVLEAAAYALPHPTLGEQVGLTIAAAPDADLENVSAFLATRLATYKCPRKIQRLDELPRLPNAKLDRLLIKRSAVQALNDRLETANGPLEQGPSDNLSQTIARLWSKQLNCRAPSANDDFFDMGGDSLSAVTFLMDLEAAIGRKVQPNLLFEAPTFQELVAQLAQTSAQDAQDLQPRSPVTEFITSKMAGWPGQVSMPGGLFRGMGTLRSGTPLFWSCQDSKEAQNVADTLGRTRPCHFVISLLDFPDREDGHFDQLAAQLSAEIVELQPSGPILMGGFCGGAWVMHHVADHLIALGREVMAFVSFDYWPDRATAFPVVHGMSLSRRHSAKRVFQNYDLAIPILHPKGAEVFSIETNHDWSVAQIEPHLARINGALAAPDKIGVRATPCPDTWPLERRKAEPSAKVEWVSTPRFFSRGNREIFTIGLRNTSDEVWQPTDKSGLALVADLLNFDWHVRSHQAGYGPIEKAVEPGELAELEMSLEFPNVRFPLVAQFTLTNQGVERFSTKQAGQRLRVIFPKP